MLVKRETYTTYKSFISNHSCCRHKLAFTILEKHLQFVHFEDHGGECIFKAINNVLHLAIA